MPPLIQQDQYQSMAWKLGTPLLEAFLTGYHKELKALENEDLIYVKIEEHSMQKGPQVLIF